MARLRFNPRLLGSKRHALPIPLSEVELLFHAHKAAKNFKCFGSQTLAIRNKHSGRDSSLGPRLAEVTEDAPGFLLGE